MEWVLSVVSPGFMSAAFSALVGRLAAMARAVDIIAAFLLPFALLWLVLGFVQHGDEPPRDEDDDGGGRPPDDPDTVPPSGGLDIDWARFEADVYAYAQSREVVAQRLLARHDAHLGAIDERPALRGKPA